MALLYSLKYPVKEIENKRKVQKYIKNIIAKTILTIAQSHSLSSGIGIQRNQAHKLKSGAATWSEY